MDRLITQTTLIPTNGIRLHAETAGPVDGPLVVLLHGFPEYWGGWDGQIGALARSGFFVVAPDQRGYNLSDKPQGVAAYDIDALVGDVLGLLDHYGRQQAVIIGHDWGALVAWSLALSHPERVAQLVILNVPHPAAMARALSTLTRQVLGSWYIYFFQIPRLPEFLLSLGNYAPLRRSLSASSRPGTFSKEDLKRYTAAWAQPGALTAMINWYRALARRTLHRGRDAAPARRVTVPTLILWGEKDTALIPQLAQWSVELCDQGTLVRFPEATHWVQHEEAERVNNRILDAVRDLLSQPVAEESTPSPEASGSPIHDEV